VGRTSSNAPMSGLYTDAGTCNIVRQQGGSAMCAMCWGVPKPPLSIFINFQLHVCHSQRVGGAGRKRQGRGQEGRGRRETRGYESLTDGAAEPDVPILLCAWLCWQWQQHLDHLRCPNLGVSATFTHKTNSKHTSKDFQVHHPRRAVGGCEIKCRGVQSGEERQADSVCRLRLLRSTASG